MSKKDRVVAEKIEQTSDGSYNWGKALGTTILLGGCPVGMLAGDESPQYKATLWTDGNEKVSGSGATPEDAKAAAYKNMK